MTPKAGDRTPRPSGGERPANGRGSCSLRLFAKGTTTAGPAFCHKIMLFLLERKSRLFSNDPPGRSGGFSPGEIASRFPNPRVSVVQQLAHFAGQRVRPISTANNPSNAGSEICKARGRGGGRRPAATAAIFRNDQPADAATRPTTAKRRRQKRKRSIARKWPVPGRR